MADPKKIAVKVRAVPKGGFWRAGRHWPGTLTDAEVTPAELEVLKREPKLIVLDGDVKVLDAKASDKGIKTP